jgi:hypothetical protein
MRQIDFLSGIHTSESTSEASSTQVTTDVNDPVPATSLTACNDGDWSNNFRYAACKIQETALGACMTLSCSRQLNILVR